MSTPYANRGGNSSVVAYDYDPANPTWIEVEFGSGRWKHYLYEAARIGQGNVQQMITLAQGGRGLGAWINTHAAVKNGYSRKW